MRFRRNLRRCVGSSYMAKLAIPKTKSSTHFTHFFDGDALPATALHGAFLTHQQAGAVRGRSATLLRVPRLSSVYASRMTPMLNDTTAFVHIMLYISMTIKYAAITMGILWRASRKPDNHAPTRPSPSRCRKSRTAQMESSANYSQAIFWKSPSC